MTNEELALYIQIGHVEYYATLWSKCRNLLYKILRSLTAGLELPVYMSREDLEQELYFALCKAVNAYDDTKPYRFNTYLNYSVKRMLRECLPTGGKSTLETSTTSYNKNVGDDEQTELIELLEDVTAAESFEGVELTDEQRIVRECISDLPSTYRRVIYLHYYRNMTFKQIGEELDLSVQEIAKLSRKAIDILSRDRRLKQLYNEYVGHYGFYLSARL